jgi:endonuclease/exonuclease/phosphatase family metal-dependent hydrolase
LIFENSILKIVNVACASVRKRLFLSYVLAIAVCCLPFDVFSSDDEISVMSYNLWNYFVKNGRHCKKKTESSKHALIKTILSASPDILMFSELGGAAALADLMKRLKKAGGRYTYAQLMHGADETRYIGVVSKFPPLRITKITDMFYRLRPKFNKKAPLESVPIQRGFLHAVFKKNGYTLHIIEAHLKARLFHYRYNQTDMRRSEARQLRHVVDLVLKKDPDANVLVVGDFNDVYSSSAIAAIRGDDKKLKLIDLKPRDSRDTTWTHWWKEEDEYGRIDYAFVSPALLPEIDRKKCRIIHLPDYWLYASDHRPLLTVIKTR